MKKLLAAVCLILILCIGMAKGDIIGPTGIVLKYINDPGFTGYMSKYETTNAQYCQFLNAAKASGDITVSDNDVIGTSGDFVDHLYYNLAGSGWDSDGSTSGGAARINYINGAFSTDIGFENHPVTYVSWYGATSFCNYYGYRLPTKLEWQAVADFDGTYNYGCGIDINNDIANYAGSLHPDGTTVVGAFGTYGYGMADMAGNVWEWTSTISDSSNIRGGCFDLNDNYCTVSYNTAPLSGPDHANYTIGFRVVPEPAMILLLTLGGLVLRKKHR